MDRGLSGGSERCQLTVDVQCHGSRAVVAPEGELDHHSADLLADSLRDCLGQGCTRIVIDCSRLAFCDSTGLNVLLTARLQAEAVGGRIHLAAMQPLVSRVFAITGAGAVFTVHESVSAALAGAAPATD